LALIGIADEQDHFFSNVVLPSRPGNKRNSEATIFKLKDGYLLLAWNEFYSDDGTDIGPSRISAMVSNNDGQTWKDKHTLQENIGKLNVMEANLLRLRSGKVMFVFLRQNSLADLLPMIRISTDDAQSFSPPKAIPIDPYPSYTGLNNDRIIQLSSGRVLAPVVFCKDYRVEKHLRSRVYYSDDEGETWKASRTIIDVKESQVGADEPGVVELGDRRVMLWVRTSAGHPYQSYSHDGGETWSDPKPMNVDAPNSPQSIKRIPSTNDLLLVWNNSRRDRFPLAVAISKDDGQTWNHLKNLDDDPAHTYAYTSITFIGREVLFSYYAGSPVGKVDESGGWSLKLKRVPLRWLYQ
jgi:sialidase-1